MRQIVPAPIEEYLSSLNRWHDEVLDEIARQGRTEGLPIVDPAVGCLLRTLVTAMGAKRVLEIGTAIGYSGTWIGRALPRDGMLITLELDPDRARRARENFLRAGLSEKVSVMIGDSQRLVAKLAGPFDLIFNDGDKFQYELLRDRLVSLLRPGGLLVTDNILWNGEVVPGFVASPERSPESAAAIAAYNTRLAADERLMTTFLPLRDGVAVSVRMDQ